MTDPLEDLWKPKRRAYRYARRESKGQVAFPGLEAPEPEKKKGKGALAERQKKLNKAKPKRGVER